MNALIQKALEIDDQYAFIYEPMGQLKKIIPNKRMEYMPKSRFVRMFFPKNEFVLEQKGEFCKLTASGTYRVGRLGKFFFKKAIENGLSSVKKHMREEGENLKIILES